MIIKAPLTVVPEDVLTNSTEEMTSIALQNISLTVGVIN